jgi:putative chitinase
MQLSEHFSLEELTATQVRGADNSLPPSLLDAMRDTAVRMESVRSALGRPIIVTSGYRSALVNKIVGGVPNSAHMSARAVDFICPAFGSPRDVCSAIQRSGIKFDQLIWEYGWVHISFDLQMRGQVLTKHSASAPFVEGLAA